MTTQQEVIHKFAFELRQFVEKSSIPLFDYYKNKTGTAETFWLSENAEILQDYNGIIELARKERICPFTFHLPNFPYIKLVFRQQEATETAESETVSVSIETGYITEIQVEEDRLSYIPLASTSHILVLSPYHCVYKTGKGRTYPFLFSFVNFLSPHFSSNRMREECQKYYSLLYSCLDSFSDLYLWKDIRREYPNIDTGEKCLVPVSFAELFQYHTKKEWILAKTAKKYQKIVQVNWNKYPLLFSYLLLKSARYLTPEALRRVINFPKRYQEIIIHSFNEEVQLENRVLPIKEQIEIFLNKVISVQIHPHHQVYKNARTNYFIDDYIEMHIDTKTLLSLQHKTLKGVINEHDKIAQKIDMQLLQQQYPKFKIPKRSKFLKLREILPMQFTWIQTIEDLVREGKEMHNCVTSYASLIQKDECAIYDAEINGRRYCIEFRINEMKQYYIRQMELPCNRGYFLNDIAVIERLGIQNRI